jgi:hypothetical protein
MAILHYQRLGRFGVNIDDTWPLSEDEEPDDDTDTDGDELSNIDDLVTDVDQDEADPDDEEPNDTDTLDDASV